MLDGFGDLVWLRNLRLGGGGDWITGHLKGKAEYHVTENCMLRFVYMCVVLSQ